MDALKEAALDLATSKALDLVSGGIGKVAGKIGRIAAKGAKRLARRAKKFGSKVGNRLKKGLSKKCRNR